MMRNTDKGERRRSGYDPMQVSNAVAATSNEAIREAFLAMTLPKEQPSDRQGQKQRANRSEAGLK